TARPIYARLHMETSGPAQPPGTIGEPNRAEQIRPLGRRSTTAISGWRFPRDLAGNLCALRGDRGADTARRAEILERRSAGGLCAAERRAAAAFSRRAEDLSRVDKGAPAPCPPTS